MIMGVKPITRESKDLISDHDFYGLYYENIDDFVSGNTMSEFKNSRLAPRIGGL